MDKICSCSLALVRCEVVAAVRWEKVFLWALHELKKFAFFANQKFSIYRKLYKLHSKPLFYAQKILLYVPFFAVCKNFRDFCVTHSLIRPLCCWYNYKHNTPIFRSLQEGTAILPAESGILRRKHKFLLNFGCSSDIMNNVNAGVMELVDVTDSKSVGSDTVWVRVPPPAPNRNTIRQGGVPFLLCKSVAK